MLYRLLRNNKESGPFTAEQLKEMGLKPYDLLWTEGRGAAWQYPSEVPELKAFAPAIEEQPFDRFYKKKETQPVAAEVATTTVKRVKPRFRIQGDKIIMVEAGNMEVANGGVITEMKAPVRTPKEPAGEKSDWQTMYTEWQPREEKMAPKEQPVQKEEPVEIETKYSESLDTLKRRYAEKVLHEKSSKPSLPVVSSSLKQNLMAAAAILVLALGGFFGYQLKQKDANTSDPAAGVERADVVEGNEVASPQTKNEINTSSAEKENTVSTKPAPVQNNSTASQVDPNASAANNETDNRKEIARTQTKNNALGSPEGSKTTAGKVKEAITQNNSSVAGNKPVSQQAGKASNAAATTPPVTETQPVVKKAAPKKIDDYISVKKMGGSAGSVENIRLLVNNISDFPIDLAVIDVQYFDSRGKYQKGETMYVKNIDGGNNVEIRVPDSEKSTSIKYKVSLVSSEEKTLYLVAE